MCAILAHGRARRMCAFDATLWLASPAACPTPARVRRFVVRHPVPTRLQSSVAQVVGVGPSRPPRVRRAIPCLPPAPPTQTTVIA